MIATALLVLHTVQPNVIIFFADDMGIGDLSCYGNKKIRTRNIDQLANEGVRFSNFYVSSPACTPSRASLMTGCYPTRVSLPQVLVPQSKTGLNPNETTIAEIAKSRGYRTAIFGKWHLGVGSLLPRTHGFDEFYGVPYSHDMWPNNKNGTWPPLWVHENESPKYEIKTLDDQSQLTRELFEKSVQFVEKNRNQPFLMYVPLHMPHVPIATSAKWRGKSKQGLYSDMLLELDEGVGQVVKAVKRNRLDRQTMIIFSSDNGPWNPYGDHAGSAGGFREGKGTTFEGGVRVPGIFWMPGYIPAAKVQDEVASTMDILPTFTSMCKGELPKNKVDGHDISNLLTCEKGARTPWKWMYFYWPAELQAIRSGDWKLHVPHNHRHQAKPGGKNGEATGEVTQKIELSLFDLKSDPGETKNIALQHPEVVTRLMRLIDVGRRELGDSLTKSVGDEVRSPGQIR